MPDKRAYQLTLNEAQAKVLIRALDSFSRIHIGQLETAITQILVAEYAQSEGLEGEFTRIRDKLMPSLAGVPLNGSHGIRNDQVSDEARIAWDLQKVIRHAVAWAEMPEGGFRVDFDKPVKSSETNSLAQITVIE